MAETVKGFLKAFSPSQNGSLISLAPRTFKHTAAGFEIEDSSGSNLDLLSLNHDMVLSHSVTKTDSLMAESDWAFTSSAKGLLLSKLMVESHSPPTAPSTRVYDDRRLRARRLIPAPTRCHLCRERTSRLFNLKFTDCLRPTRLPRLDKRSDSFWDHWRPCLCLRGHGYHWPPLPRTCRPNLSVEVPTDAQFKTKISRIPAHRSP